MKQSTFDTQRDDLPRVRGKIELRRQITTHFGRADKIACLWDEYSSDNALNRVFKCALDFLRRRVRHSGAKRMLSRCLSSLEQVELVSSREALSGAARIKWTPQARRFERHFRFAARLLRGQSPDFGAQHSQSWVFLTDMNALFESFCARALEDRLGIRVLEQDGGGPLFGSPNAPKQVADFVWQRDEKWCVGDAKWKLLGALPPTFSDDDDELKQSKPKSLSPADVRQLTVYSELLKGKKLLDYAPQMWVFYPTLDEFKGMSQSRETWNESRLWRVPVRVCKWVEPRDALEL